METWTGGSDEHFATTHWSLLERGDWAQVLRLYWKPVYAHLRRKGCSIEDAKDLTQEFFTVFVEKEYGRQADRSRGRFRNFLRAAVDHLHSNMRDRENSRIRGGGNILPLDTHSVERYLSPRHTPEQEFDRQWARSVLDQALTALEKEYASRGQAQAFARLRPHLIDGGAEDRVALHRARRRFGELVRQLVARTLSSPEEVESELSILFNSL